MQSEIAASRRNCIRRRDYHGVGPEGAAYDRAFSGVQKKPIAIHDVSRYRLNRHSYTHTASREAGLPLE